MKKSKNNRKKINLPYHGKLGINGLINPNK